MGLTFLVLQEQLMSENLSPSAENSMIKQLETSRRMSLLVKNLLDLSRMEQQDILDNVQMDLSVLNGRIFDDYTDVLAAKGIRIRNQVGASLPVTGDSEKLFRLFVNLIDNAIRYNLSSGGEIKIKGKKSKTDVCVEILNSGSKIPKQDIPR
ncbi:MAG: HAMP domain-containing histidine kinase, partial [Desulfobacter sp.]|nr:HAMP domain-containing histidine kinase [Desulfobacter sp.]